ncbi:MAG: hypothetical protein ABSD58_14395 [Verrucomicrobiia bacterium]|jgi:hypothetical protein
MTSSRVKSAIGIAILILSVVGILVLLQAPISNPVDGRLALCMAHERQLGLAIAMFAEDHGGTLPGTLEDLAPYHGSTNVLFCPSAKDRIQYSYVLTGATNVWGAGTNTIILLEFEANHRGKRVVLFDDGHVDLKVDSEL